MIRLPDNLKDEKGLNEFKNQFASLPVSVKEAITDLYPQSPSSVYDREFESVGGQGVLQYKYNNFGLDSSGCGLAVTASRFNHRCAPNCGRKFIADHNLLTIFVESPIFEGEELTISYTSKKVQEGVEAFQKHMMSAWNFVCTCNICSSTQLFSMLIEIHKIDEKIFTLGSTGHEKQAFQLGEQRIKLMDEMGRSVVG